MKEWESFDKITRGKGIWLIDSKGNKMIDAVASMWCNVWGHSNPHLIKQLQNKARNSSTHHCLTSQMSLQKNLQTPL